MPACVRHLFDARRLIRERWLGGAMLSLSLGRDGWVEAAAPAPRIECALLRCAAFVAVQLVLVVFEVLHTGERQAWRQLLQATRGAAC